MGVAGIDNINIANPNVMACLFVGAMLPFLFSAMAITLGLAMLMLSMPATPM
jgi:Na+/H+-translocating membrane pyrophosphatase